MFGKRKLKKKIEELKRQHGVLVSRNKTLQNENKIFINNLEKWEELSDYVSEYYEINNTIMMPDQIIKILKNEL